MTEAYVVPVMEADRIRAGLALQLVAASTGIAAETMTGRERLSPIACRARWLAMYLSHITFGWPLERVAHAFGVNRATAGTACRWVEDERDRPVLDALLDRLEDCVRLIVEAGRLDLSQALGNRPAARGIGGPA
jgi:chromosomal replication initiation ATPase DnaA